MSYTCIHLRNAVALSLVLGLGATGCATKKYVAKTVNPVETRVSATETKTAEQAKALDTLETDLSKTKERVMDLDSNLKQTSERATAAGTRAEQAASEATKAQQQATEARTHADQRTDQLKTYVDALDTFKQARTSNVLFPFGKSNLNAEAKAAIDEIAKDAVARKKFIFEVEGYTDNQGPTTANLTLSQRRAETVVRYLNTAHNVPLRTIHLMGVGSEMPASDNKTREGRRQNRRVEIRLFAPEVEASSALSSAQLR